jgi:type I restriction enzyme M protein
MSESHEVIFLNPRTCGIYKNGAIRYKTDPSTGLRTDEIDNELIASVDAYIEGNSLHRETHIPLDHVFDRKVLVSTYYDERYNEGIKKLLEEHDVEPVTLGELFDEGVIAERGGHGSPGNDQRTGTIPYIKVSDIRGLRINVNPTNLVTESIAHRFWRGDSSRLQAWDILTPNRASSNIGEFAILLPGEERIVLTKEVFVFRIIDDTVWNPFYLLWALSLKSVRDQWRRIALMQTNREDCGNRYREIILPKPRSKDWARQVSKAFHDYFATIANAKTTFIAAINSDEFEYVANVSAESPSTGDFDLDSD